MGDRPGPRRRAVAVARPHAPAPDALTELTPSPERTPQSGPLAPAVLQQGSGRKPDVRLELRESGPVVVKDFAGRAPWLRATLGRWLVARELRAYRALAGHPNVPRLLGRAGRYGLAVEYRPGRRLSRQRATELPADFLARLTHAVAEMHARGVVHLDLRHRSNVLVGADGEPILIDFASAVCLRPERGLERVLLRALARLDERALAKWRAKLAQSLESSGSGGVGGAGSSEVGRSASRPT